MRVTFQNDRKLDRKVRKLEGSHSIQYTRLISCQVYGIYLAKLYTCYDVEHVPMHNEGDWHQLLKGAT